MSTVYLLQSSEISTRAKARHDTTTKSHLLVRHFRDYKENSVFVFSESQDNSCNFYNIKYVWCEGKDQKYNSICHKVFKLSIIQASE